MISGTEHQPHTRRMKAMKIKTSIKAGGTKINHNQTAKKIAAA